MHMNGTSLVTARVLEKSTGIQSIRCVANGIRLPEPAVQTDVERPGISSQIKPYIEMGCAPLSIRTGCTRVSRILVTNRARAGGSLRFTCEQGNTGIAKIGATILILIAVPCTAASDRRSKMVGHFSGCF